MLRRRKGARGEAGSRNGGVQKTSPGRSKSYSTASIINPDSSADLFIYSPPPEPASDLGHFDGRRWRRDSAETRPEGLAEVPRFSALKLLKPSKIRGAGVATTVQATFDFMNGRDRVKASHQTERGKT
jgi:hypothetical protein